MTLLEAFWRDSETPTVISRPVVTRIPPPPEPEAATGLATQLPRGHRPPARSSPASPAHCPLHRPPTESCSCCHPGCGLRLVRRFSPRPRAVLMHPNAGRIHLYLPLSTVRYLTLIAYQQGRYLFPYALVSPAGKPHVHPVPLPQVRGQVPPQLHAWPGRRGDNSSHTVSLNKVRSAFVHSQQASN